MKKIIFTLFVFGCFLFAFEYCDPLDMGIKFLEDDSLYATKEVVVAKTRKGDARSGLSAKELFALGQQCMQKGKYKLAIDYFTKAIKLDPVFYNAYKERALAKDKIQDYTGSKKDYETYMKLRDRLNIAQIEKEKRMLKNRIILANRKVADKKYDEAVVDFTNIISAYPKFPDGYIARADTYVLLNKNAEALKDYNKALAINDVPNITLYLKTAETAYKLKKYSEAINNYIQIVRLSPNYEYAHYKMVGAYIFIEKFDKALTSLNKYISCSREKNIQTSDYNEWDKILNKYSNNTDIRDLKSQLKSLKFVQTKKA
ncbi:MAG: tetratricopeptide repeat protein [Elusimicrobia bacterium]|nr:tetratricopeptide repeat protein [Elusimicrobiota bacterium]